MTKRRDMHEIRQRSSNGHRAAVDLARTVLIVVQEPLIRELLATQLRALGCFPMAVPNSDEGRRLTAQLVPDLIVIDLDASPGADAAWACQLVQTTQGKTVRTVMLSADALQACGVDGLGCGADLCIAKPFEPRELMDQILSLMRSPAAQPRCQRSMLPATVTSIELDPQQPTVRLLLPKGWRTLDLPRMEHSLLAYLLSDAERARSREAIRDAVWNATPVDLRTVDQYVRRLRRTLDAAGARQLVKTIKGVGYRLDLEVLQRAPVSAAAPRRA